MLSVAGRHEPGAERGETVDLAGERVAVRRGQHAERARGALLGGQVGRDRPADARPAADRPPVLGRPLDDRLGRHDGRVEPGDRLERRVGDLEARRAPAWTRPRRRARRPATAGRAATAGRRSRRRSRAAGRCTAASARSRRYSSQVTVGSTRVLPAGPVVRNIDVGTASDHSPSRSGWAIRARASWRVREHDRRQRRRR